MAAENLHSYIQYESYDKAIERMKTPEQKYKLYRVIADYGLYGIEPNYTGDDLVDMALEFIIPLLTTSMKRKEAAANNGRFGGAPKGNTNAKKTTKNNQKTTQFNPKSTENNPATTKNKLNVNVNANSNANVNATVNDNANANVNVNVNDNSLINKKEIYKEKVEERNPYIDINTMSIIDFDRYDEWNREHGIEG